MRLSCDPILFLRDLVLDRTMSLEDWFERARELRLYATEIQPRMIPTLARTLRTRTD